MACMSWLTKSHRSRCVSSAFVLESVEMDNSKDDPLVRDRKYLTDSQFARVLPKFLIKSFIVAEPRG